MALRSVLTGQYLGYLQHLEFTVLTCIHARLNERVRTRGVEDTHAISNPGDISNTGGDFEAGVRDKAG